MSLDGPAIISCKVAVQRSLCVGLVTSMEKYLWRGFTGELITNNSFKSVNVVFIKSERIFDCFGDVHQRTSDPKIIERFLIAWSHPAGVYFSCIKGKPYFLSLEHIRRNDIHQEWCSNGTVSNVAIPRSLAIILDIL